MPRLALPLVLDAAVEEVGHVGVLLGLGRVELAQRRACDEHLGERVGDGLLREDDRAVELLAVARHRRQVELRVEQQPRELPRAVGAEVEEDRAVAGLEPRRALDRRSAR